MAIPQLPPSDPHSPVHQQWLTTMYGSGTQPWTSAGGKSTPTANVDRFTRMTPKQQLASLLAQGYNVNGGIGGSQFATASKAYIKGIPTGYWNKVSAANLKAQLTARANAAHAAAISAHDPNSVSTTPPPSAGDTSIDTSGGVDTTPVSVPTLKSLGVPGLNYKFIDPTALANSITGAQYNPQISALQQQLVDARKQGTQNQADIKAWYDTLANDLATTTASDASAAKAQLADHDAGVQGILNVLGGNVGAANSAAAFGAIDRGALEKLQASRANYDSALAPAFRSQGADAALTQLNRDRTAQQDLAQQLTAARTAKGTAFAGAYQNALDDNLKNQVAAINAKSQLAMLPYQVAQAQTGLATSNANLKMAGLQYNTQVLKNQILGQQANGPVPLFGKLNPEQLTGLSNQLLSQAVSSKDPLKLAHNPMDVYQAWGTALRSMSGGKWDARTSGIVNKWRNDLLASRLPEWNRSHPKQQYAFRNGVLVKK